MDPRQLLEFVVRPTLKKIGWHSEAAEQLVLGTIWQESRGKYIKQLHGPALGLVQMEPETHDDIWINFLEYRRELSDLVCQLLSVSAAWEMTHAPPFNELIANLNYSVAMCRVHYLRVAEPLPKAGNVEGMAAYWKKYYNTRCGKGTAEEFVKNYPKVLKGNGKKTK